MTPMRPVAAILLALLAIASRAIADEPYLRQIPDLIQRLQSQDAGDRADAARRLGYYGPEAKPAVTALVPLLNDRAVYSRDFPFGAVVSGVVEQALVAIGSEAVPDLVKAVAANDSAIGQRASSILASLGPKALAALPVLLSRFEDRDQNLRFQIIHAVAQIDGSGEQAIPLLLTAMKDVDHSIRAGAASRLGTYGKGADRAVPALLQALQDPESEVRGSAATALGEVGTQSDTVVPALIVLLQSRGTYLYAISNHLFDSRSVRGDAATALAKYQRVESIQPLLAALKAELQDQAWVSSSVLDALGNHGDAAAAAVPLVLTAVRRGDPVAALVLPRFGAAARSTVGELQTLLKNSDSDVQLAAAAALAGLDVKNQPEAFQVVLQTLRDQVPDAVPYLTMDILYELGPNAALAVPDLIRCLKRDEHSLHWRLAQVLGRIGPSAREAGPILLNSLHEHSLSRQEAADALLGIGPQMIPLLIELLEDADRTPERRTIAAEVLGRFGPRAEEAVPELVACLTSEGCDFRIAVTKSLGEIHSRPDLSLPSLLSALKDLRPAVRAQAAESLGEFGTDGATAVDALIAALLDEYIDVRVGAARGLGRLGATAAPSLPALRQAALDPNPYIQAEVEAALKSIGN